jgi:hypothetical protein
MESAIKWQTGEPKEWGSYIVTLEDGTVTIDSWEWSSYCDEEGLPFWVENNYYVVAWCKPSDIKPYKEETNKNLQ